MGEVEKVADAVADLICRLHDDAGLCRERSIQCRKILDTNGAETASQICDDLDEARALLTALHARNEQLEAQLADTDELGCALETALLTRRAQLAEANQLVRAIEGENTIVRAQLVEARAAALDLIKCSIRLRLREEDRDYNKGFNNGLFAAEALVIRALAPGCEDQTGPSGDVT